jgi:glycosyltransferase involved in cell wall biosynthesis
MKRTAVIYVCKGKPSRGGGGLGVAYNYLSATWAKVLEPASADHILLCGMAETLLPAAGETLDDFLSALDTGARQGASLFAWQAFRLRRIARRYERTVILTFAPYYLWPLVGFWGGGNIVAVHSEHSKGGRHHELAEETGSFGWRARFIQWCVGFNFRDTDRVVFPSRGALNLFTGKNPHLKQLAESKAAITYNGVAVCEAPPLRETSGPLKIVSVAHHVREKGLDTMLEGLRLATNDGADWTMVNYGNKTELTRQLAAQAEQSGIAGRIDFAGLKPQAEVRESLAKADVFLHTPVVVVFDLSLLEAMMHAVPIVITPLEGNREALGEDYPLYASTPEEIAAKLEWVGSHRLEAAKIGMALRERALAKFTNEAMAGQYAALLGSLLC